MAELPSRAVAPPKSIRRGPTNPGEPSSPTAGTAVSVCPHRHPGPSSFLSIAASTTVYPGAGLGPATGPGDAAAAVGVPGAEGDGDADGDCDGDGDGDAVGVSLPDPDPPPPPPRASESESDSVAMRESTSIAARQASPPAAAAPRVSRAEHGDPPHARARAQPRVTAALGDGRARGGRRGRHHPEITPMLGRSPAAARCGGGAPRRARLGSGRGEARRWDREGTGRAGGKRRGPWEIWELREASGGEDESVGGPGEAGSGSGKCGGGGGLQWKKRSEEETAETTEDGQGEGAV